MKRSPKLSVVLSALALPALLTGVAAAQQELPISPTIREFANPPVLLSGFLLLVVGGIAIGVNLLPSKRGHQD